MRGLSLLIVLPLCFAVQGAWGDVCTHVAPLVQHAERLRGLRFKRSIRCRALPSEELREQFFRVMSSDVDTSLLEQEERVFHILGIVPESYPYASCILQGQAEHVQAFFSFRDGELLLPSDAPSPQRHIVHELVHALQSEHFSLPTLRTVANRSSDASNAISALIEGDAMFIEKLFVESGAATEAQGTIPPASKTPHPLSHCELPQSLKLLGGFPYDYGLVFAERLYRAGGLSRLNEAYRHPPSSTTQIMVSRAYVQGTSHRRAAPLAIPSQPLQGRLLYQDTLGQFAMQTLLKNFLPEPSAVRSALGWRGDRLLLVDSTAGERQLIWNTRWEDATRAERFAFALSEAFSKRYGLKLAHSPRIQFRTASGGTWRIRHAGLAVALDYTEASNISTG